MPTNLKDHMNIFLGIYLFIVSQTTIFRPGQDAEIYVIIAVTDKAMDIIPAEFGRTLGGPGT